MLTITDVARRLGIRPWQARRLFERNLLPPAKRASLYRIFEEADLPAIREAAEKAGYLQPVQEEAELCPII